MTSTGKRKSILVVIILFCLVTLASYSIYTGNGFFGLGRDVIENDRVTTVCNIIPKPVSYTPVEGEFLLTSASSIVVDGKDAEETKELYQIAEYLLGILRPSTGYSLSIMKEVAPTSGSILLTTENADNSLVLEGNNGFEGNNSFAGNNSLASYKGFEGYKLDITSSLVTIRAMVPEGVFLGVQSLRQMLPPEIEKDSLVTDILWSIPCANLFDYPAFEWRGLMLDTARHFISVENVKRTIDLMAAYKLNRLHLHLTDDQGWRIEIKSWPELTAIGGSSEIGGGEGGYYTQADYKAIFAYAKDRYITVIPEIEMPGHCNAALASYGELNPDGIQKVPYTGMEVGFSSLMCRSEITYGFLEDVIRELSALTPGEYLHIGGDEASSTSDEDYSYLITEVKGIANRYGKKVIGWNPYDSAEGITSEDLLQNWSGETDNAVKKNMKIILSPPDKAYLDMKYYENSPIGLEWAGYTTTMDGYTWDPTDYAPLSSVLGIEGVLWSETITSMDNIEYLAFPRLLGLAEIGWTPADSRSWKDYQNRLITHAIRMDYQEIHYFKDPVVDWQP